MGTIDVPLFVKWCIHVKKKFNLFFTITKGRKINGLLWFICTVNFSTPWPRTKEKGSGHDGQQKLWLLISLKVYTISKLAGKNNWSNQQSGCTFCIIPRREASSNSSRGKFLTLKNQKETKSKIKNKKLNFQDIKENSKYDTKKSHLPPD